MAGLVRNNGRFENFVIRICINPQTVREVLIRHRIIVKSLEFTGNDAHLNLAIVGLKHIHAVHGLKRSFGQIQTLGDRQFRFA